MSKKPSLLNRLLSGEKDVSNLKVPNLREGVSLRNYQKVAAAIFFSYDGIILYDQMGFGKTLQSFSGYALKKKQNPELKLIYSTVKSGIYQAEDEFNRFFSDLKTQIIGGKQTKKKRLKLLEEASADVYFIPHRVTVLNAAEIIRNLAPFVIVFDEANYFKGVEPLSQAHKNSKVLSKYSEATWLLTADPVENSLLDAFGLMDIIDQNIFGSLKEFNSKFSIMTTRKVPAPAKLRKLYGKPFMEIESRLGFRNKNTFRKLFNLRALGRTREDVQNELPDLTINNIYLDYSPKQLSSYKEVEKGLFSNVNSYNDLREADEEGSNHLENFIRCMQFIGNPFVLKEMLNSNRDDIEDREKELSISKARELLQESEDNDDALESGNSFTKEWISHFESLSEYIDDFTKEETIKSKEIKRLLSEDLKGQKVIVFSSYRTVIDYLESNLKNSYKILRITGSENSEQREKNRKLFTESSEYNVMLITTAALRALNLQIASAVICHDVPRTWGKLRQLIGRIIRIGSKHSMVNLITLLVNETVDVKMYEKLYKTQKDVENLLGNLGKDKVVDYKK